MDRLNNYRRKSRMAFIKSARNSARFVDFLSSSILPGLLHAVVIRCDQSMRQLKASCFSVRIGIID
jgi:hypothetical protein